MISTPRKQLPWVEPATPSLLRAAGSVSVFLELPQDKGGRQTSWEKETEKKLSGLEEDALCFP